MKYSDGAFLSEVFSFEEGGKSQTARFGLSLEIPQPDLDSKNAASA